MSLLSAAYIADYVFVNNVETNADAVSERIDYLSAISDVGAENATKKHEIKDVNPD